MVFIRARKVVRDEEGNIISGSAAIIEAEYVKNAEYHSKQSVRERLGKIIELDEEKKCGIFLSETRGLVRYDAVTDTFTPLKTTDENLQKLPRIPETKVHTVFGDTYLLLEFLKKTVLIRALRGVFSVDSDFERELCHLLHGILKDGSHIGCDDFIEKSFFSYVLEYILPESLASDTKYFSLLGNDEIRVAFFRTFIKQMRRKHRGFGHGCYVDSTPLPNSITDNPFNALSNHGTGCKQEQMRLILVLDQETGLPIWFDLIPGNVLDLSTTMQILEDAENTLDIEISELILDAGYASKELLKSIKTGEMRSVICRMPKKNGYPFDALYQKFKSMINKPKYGFIRENHTYFGVKEVVDIFDEDYFAYVYVDQDNALYRAREYILKHPKEYERMTNKEKEWRSVSGGFFILISTWDVTPKELLDEYFGRTNIEDVFKTSKSYLQLLPLSKWTDQTVRGKILSDVINTIGYLELRKELGGTGVSVSKLIGKTQSLMCFKGKNDYVTIETPNKQTKEIYGHLKIEIPAHLKVKDFKDEIFTKKM